MTHQGTVCNAAGVHFGTTIRNYIRVAEGGNRLAAAAVAA